MTPIAPEKKGQVAALLGAVVLVFVFVIFRVVGSLSSSPEPAPVAAAGATTAVAGAPTIVASNAPVPAATGDEEIEVPTLFASSSADPFRTIVDPTLPPVAVVAPPRPRPRPRPRIRPSDSEFALGSKSLQPLPVPGILPTGGTDAPPAAAEPEIHVTGVMTGKNAVAIVQVGAESYVVKEGDSFGDQNVVEGIGTDTVTVRRKGKSTRVPVGG